MLILGISGKSGVGKNFLSENFIIPKIIHNLNNSNEYIVPYFFSFGSFVKSELYSRDTSNQLNFENLFTNKTKTTRFLLQNYATENGRELFREDMWIRYVELWIDIHLDSLEKINKHLTRKLIPLFIIQDVRFENEFNFIKSKNGVLVLIKAANRHLERVKKENSSISHLSEKGLDHLEFNYIINNDPKDISLLSFEIDSFVNKFFKKMISKSYSFTLSDIENAGKSDLEEIFYHSARH